MSKFKQIVENAFAKDYEPKAFIDLNQLKNNIIHVKKREYKCQVCAVVKSDAYGHGICKIACDIEDFCDCFAVASLNEAFALRYAGITKNILCLLPIADIYSAIRINMQISVISHYDFERIYNGVKNLTKKPTIHFAINTGMNRFGYDDIEELRQDCALAKNSGIKIAGVFSHFYNSADYNSAKRQYDKFIKFAEIVKEISPLALAHISASGGLRYGEFDCDMVRIGLLIYGYNPKGCSFDVKPIMKVIAYSPQHRSLLANSTILYGGNTSEYSGEISLLNYGYYDGIEEFYNSLNINCMNISAVMGSGDFLDVTEYAINSSAGISEGIYRTLIKLGRVKNKIYYYGK